MEPPKTTRILLECELKPVQGYRFQPTGFPSLGAAEYVAETEGGRVNCLLVESTQSLANWLEKVCMGDAGPVEQLSGIPVVRLVDDDDRFIANTMTEAHRINSSYLLRGKDTALKDLLESEIGSAGKTAEATKLAFAKFLLKYDTPTLLHGAWIPELADSNCRLTRILSAFIDATGTNPAESGIAKKDSMDSTGKANKKGGSEKGYGNIINSRREYTARTIMLYFSIDLSLMRSYRLGDAAEELLLALAVWKIRKLAGDEIRFRTACDLRAASGLVVTSPEGYELPSLEEAEADLKKCIERCRAESLFADKDVAVRYDGK